MLQVFYGLNQTIHAYNTTHIIHQPIEHHNYYNQIIPNQNEHNISYQLKLVIF